MKKANKRRRRALSLMAIYVVAVAVSIFYAVSFFIENSSTRGLLAFERFSEQITLRVSDHLGRYTERMIMLKSELIECDISNRTEIYRAMQRYVDNSALEGVGFVMDDGRTVSYNGEVESFDEPIDVFDVHNYPYTVTLSKNSISGEDKLLFRILWDEPEDPAATAIYGYLPLSIFSDLLKDTTYGNAGAFISIVDHNGDHLWNSSDVLENKEGHNLIRDLEAYDLNSGASAEEVATRLELQLSGTVTYTANEDERVLFYKPLGYNYWTLLTVTPRASVLNTANEIHIIIVLLAGIASIVVIAAFFFFKNQKTELALAVAQKESIFKGKFLSNVSHELRTPLNGISGTLHLLKNSEGDQQSEYINRMESCVSQLSDIVNDVLDMAKIESGSIEVHEERFDLAELSHKTALLFDATAQAKQVELSVDISKLKNRFYVGDAKKIQQIMTNLLSNAVKFTEKGSITLTLSEDTTSDSGVCIRVSDTGCGMSLEFQKRIFQPFTQEDTTYGRTQTGTGLGMAISSELAQVLHGTISVESKPNEGSTFTVMLPLLADADQTVQDEGPAQPEISLKGVRILLAEDNEINSLIAQELLTQVGAEVKAVKNGQLAVDYFLDPAAEPVDLILMDIRMPVMDGLEAARRIRASKHPSAQSIPILALTANGLEDDNQEILAAGMNERLSKPLSVQLLYERIQHYVRGDEV